MNKSEIRKMILEKRNSLSDNEKNENSKVISEKIINTPEFKDAKCIFSFVSFGSEVDTTEIINTAIAQNKTICVPFTNSKEKKIIASKINNLEELDTKDSFGIKSPEINEVIEIEPEKIDLVIVPGLAFNVDGYRVGYGGGYYDRYLSQIPNVNKIGICFDFQVIANLPIDEFDIPVDKIITDKRII